MQRLGILVVTAVLVAGCGVSRAPIGLPALVAPAGFDALAVAKSTAYDGLQVTLSTDDARACQCTALTATNEKFTIGLQADDDKLVAVSVNGKFLVEKGTWASAKGKEDVDLAASQADAIDDMLADDPLLVDQASKSSDKARQASRALTLARIYTGLQKADVPSKARTATTAVKKAMRIFIKANTPKGDKGQIGV